jgi:hypothetical protein
LTATGSGDAAEMSLLRKTCHSSRDRPSAAIEIRGDQDKSNYHAPFAAGPEISDHRRKHVLNQKQSAVGNFLPLAAISKWLINVCDGTKGLRPWASDLKML